MSNQNDDFKNLASYLFLDSLYLSHLYQPPVPKPKLEERVIKVHPDLDTWEIHLPLDNLMAPPPAVGPGRVEYSILTAKRDKDTGKFPFVEHDGVLYVLE